MLCHLAQQCALLPLLLTVFIVSADKTCLSCILNVFNVVYQTPIPHTRKCRIYLSLRKYLCARVCVTGMSYIAAVLLMQLGEEEAFWALTALLDKPKYLVELFDLSLTK